MDGGKTRRIRFPGPLGYCLTLPLDIQKTTPSCVVVLFEGSGPSTVPRAVVPVVINAVERPSDIRRSRTHVIKEVLKGVDPTVAHCDTAAPVVRELFVVAIKAPAFHGVPSAVFRCRLPPDPAPVFSTAFSPEHPQIPTETPTRLGFPSPKLDPCHLADLPAITQAKEMDQAPPIRGPLLNQQAAEFQANHSNLFSGHGLTIAQNEKQGKRVRHVFKT